MVFLADPSLKTIGRIVAQYDAAGLGGDIDDNAYWQLGYRRHRLDTCQKQVGYFDFALHKMRRQHGAFV